MFNYMLNTFLSFFKSSESYSFPNRVLTSSSLKSSISSCNHLAPLSLSFSLSLSLSLFVRPPLRSTSGTRETSREYSLVVWGIPIFHKQTGKPGRVHTFARLFFRQTAARTRSKQGGRRATGWRAHSYR